MEKNADFFLAALPEVRYQFLTSIGVPRTLRVIWLLCRTEDWQLLCRNQADIAYSSINTGMDLGDRSRDHAALEAWVKLDECAVWANKPILCVVPSFLSSNIGMAVRSYSRPPIPPYSSNISARYMDFGLSYRRGPLTSRLSFSSPASSLAASS